MNILFVTAFPPNHRSGGQTFSLNCISRLSKKCTVDLIYFSFPGHECEADEFTRNVKSFLPSLKNLFFNPFEFPLFTKRFKKEILLYLKEIASCYDVIYFDFTQVAIYSLFITHPCKVVRCHDIMAQKFSRKNKFFLRWIRHTEKKMLKSASYVFVPSKKDALLLENTYGIKAFFTNEYLTDFNFPKSIQNRRFFLFFGLWSRNENLSGLVWFIKNVFPFLADDIKSSLFVMGGGLSKENQKKLLESNQIKYLGFVKESYKKILEASAVIVPLFEGAGIKVKVLDAFTTGTPVIGTDVAFEGIPEIKGMINLASSAEDFAQKLNNFIPLTLEQKKENAKLFREIYDKNHLDEVLLEKISGG